MSSDGFLPVKVLVPIQVYKQLFAEANSLRITVAELMLQHTVAPRVKSNRGGRRPGAGRKSKYQSSVGRAIAEARAASKSWPEIGRTVGVAMDTARRWLAIYENEQRESAGGKGTMSKKIIVRVYTKPDCKQCDMTKAELTKRGIPFEIDDITEPGNLKAAQALGFSSAPVVIVGGEGWAGFRPDKIAELATRFEGQS